MAKTKTWELPEGRGQGPKPDPNKNLPPLKLAKKKRKVLLDSKAIWKG